MTKKPPERRQKDFKDQQDRKYPENKIIFLMEFKNNKIHKRFIKE